MYIKITIVELEPVVVQLAKRWFGVVDDDRRKTMIKDGLTAISEAKSNGDKYDAVILDACDNTKEMPCPAKTFLTSSTLTEIKSILKPMGTLIVNILPLKKQKANLEKVMKILLSHFSVCIKMQMSYEANVVVSCLPYSLASDNLEDTKQLILQRAEKASNDLGIHGVLEYLDLTIVLK
uniref:PABS domain-containing protein n=1 Tax=Panagrolaimus davidi TaxID=227884 RepID=A0A914QK55_9BILA